MTRLAPVIADVVKNLMVPKRTVEGQPVEERADGDAAAAGVAR